MPDASTPAPATSTAPTPTPTMLRAAWKDIHRSPLNPRKHFEAAPLQELAGNIAAHGILQNLVVRPHAAKPGEYELIAGERRHRAYELLIKAGKAKPEDQLPVQIRKLDDKEASFIALTENVARNDLTPMEEAHAFVRLKELGMLPKDIGPAIGKTERFVQKRIRLVVDLDPTAAKALADNKISVEQANVIVMAPKERHAELVEQIEEGGTATTEELKALATEQLIEVGDQAFPLDLYKGEFVIDDEVSGEKPVRWFKDTAQVQKLLRDEVAKRTAALKAKHAFVEVKKSEHGTSRPWDWDKAEKAGPSTGALLVWCPRSAEIEVHAPVKKPAPRNSGSSHSTSSHAKQHAYGNELARFYGDLATDAIVAALVDNPTLALRFAVFQALDSNHYGPTPPDAVMARWKALTGKVVSRDKLAQWKSVSKLDAKTLAEILAISNLILNTENQIVDNYGSEKPPGLEPWAAALAGEAKADMGKLWQFYGKPADAFLDSCGPKQLERITEDLGIEIAKGADAKAMRTAIAKNVAANRKYMPPWLQLATSDEIAKRLKATPAKKKG